MKKILLLLVCVALLFSCQSLYVQKAAPEHPIMVAGAGHLVKVNIDGSYEKLMAGIGSPHDIFVLGKDKYLVAANAQLVIVDKGKIVFSKKASSTHDGIFTAQPIADNKIMYVDNNEGMLYEMDSNGNILLSMGLTWESADVHGRSKIGRKISNGNYLVAHAADQKVREYQFVEEGAKGKVVWEYDTKAFVFAANELANGNRAIVCLDKILILNPSTNEIVWTLTSADFPSGIVAQNFTGFEELADGSFVIGCYAAYQGGANVGLFQINQNKEVLWYFNSPAASSSYMGLSIDNKSFLE